MQKGKNMNDFDNLNNTPDSEQQNNINNENNADTCSFEEKSTQQPNEDSVNDEQTQSRNDSQPDVNQGNFTQNTNSYPYGNGGQNTNSYPYGNGGQNANSYPYGNGGQNTNSYPYSNGGQNTNSYPYSNGTQNTPGYNYNRPNQPNQPNQPNNQYNGYYSNPYPYANRPKQYAYPDEAFNQNGGKKKKGKKVFVFVVVAVCILAVAGVVASIVNGESIIPPATEDNNVPIGNVDELETNATPSENENTPADGTLRPKDIYSKVLSSSVGILVYDSRKSVVSEGSGVIFSEDTDGEYTYIITCAHVISDTGVSLIVKTSDNKEYTAQVVGFDSRTDIGVVRIKASGLVAAEIGDSTMLSVGDSVYAIGNPGGVEFANSFTNGMVSAIDRPVSSSKTGYTMECIQHTAAINPGNSGGALVNEYGQVIGINSMKIVADEYEGMGFSVPSSVFTKIVNEIIANGYVTNRPKLGITYVSASEYESYAMFVAIKGLPSGAIVIYSIADDSDLKNTKAKEGDLIYVVNGVDMQDASYIAELIENGKVGDELTLSLIRIHSDYSFDEFEVKVKLVEDKGDTFLVEEETTASENDNYLPDDFYDDYDDYSYDDFYDFFNPFG